MSWQYGPRTSHSEQVSEGEEVGAEEDEVDGTGGAAKAKKEGSNDSPLPSDLRDRPDTTRKRCSFNANFVRGAHLTRKLRARHKCLVRSVDERLRSPFGVGISAKLPRQVCLGHKQDVRGRCYAGCCQLSSGRVKLSPRCQEGRWIEEAAWSLLRSRSL